MSEKSTDELQALLTITSSLADRVNESDEAISKIKEIVKNLGEEHISKEEPNEMVKPDEVQQLERERLQLVMELQKQDYIHSRLVKLVKENQELLDTIKSYIK
ncbi:hypothetical protein KGF57_002688 [Candida theae]|uniref:Uncharacterized protein n=1 Tax=Candida theae TaxID=1198502 RepID=A0AAD5BFI6_9ASCO|nr:uncharacterized protein KGF57_002688 [Candida theae]KAI5958332.1 hypothetical protein KGF57_002688 [Candida theae]